MIKDRQVKRLWHVLSLGKTMAKAADKADKADMDEETASYEQYLLELVERESQARLVKRTERLLRDSRPPLEKDLASFDMGRLPAKVSRQSRTLLEGSFVDRREHLLVFGTTGTGKTHLLSAIASVACQVEGTSASTARGGLRRRRFE